jgi:hypothetical protein
MAVAKSGSNVLRVAGGGGVISVTAGGGGGDLLFQDKFTDRTAGNVSMTSPWTSKGYTGVTATASGGVQIYARASLPAGLTGDGNFPASKSKVLRCYIPENEDEARVTNEDQFLNTREAWYSWWEYRPDTNVGGEKWLRVGNRTTPGGSRGHDIVWCFGAGATSMVLIANSANMHDYGDQSFSFPLGGRRFGRTGR